MIRAQYHCQQQDFYEVASLGWQSLEQHLAAFTAFKPKYTAAFVLSKKGQLEDAINLPDFDSRDAASETLRIELEEKAKISMANWQKLKRYIGDAFPPAVQKPKLEAAGQNYYGKAGQNEWTSVKLLLSNGQKFIDENLATLEANDNMPPAFQAMFNDSKDLFDANLQSFLDTEEFNIIKSDEKITANNTCYADLIAMFKDGQEIFKEDDAIKRQFVFETVLGIVSGTGTAGFKGLITDEATGLPIPDAAIQIQGGKSATADENGKYAITKVAAGTYQVVFSATAYQNKTVTKDVKTGTVSGLDVTLLHI